MKYVENCRMSGSPEYDKTFWNVMKGNDVAEEKLSAGRTSDTGSYVLPSAADNKYEKAINARSVIRSIASIFTSYDKPANIWAADCDDIAEFVAPCGSINIRDVADDFTRIGVNSNKLVTLLRLPREFVSDATFDIESYLVKRLAKNFARAEDKAFITGTGTNEPLGHLATRGGADVAFTADSITFDDIYRLYFSVDAEYRRDGAWLMNDSTALALRKLKDGEGNYLWNNADNTILGKPVLISEYMPDIESSSKPIAFGDFSYYWIVKRSPVSVKLLKELFALKDQTGYMAFEFIDGKLVRNDAVHVIQMNTEEPEDLTEAAH